MGLASKMKEIVPPPPPYEEKNESSAKQWIKKIFKLSPKNNNTLTKPDIISNRLLKTINDNKLYKFYDTKNIDNIVRQATLINYESISTKYEIDLTLTYDLASLVLYDVVIFCDDSGSMRSEEKGRRINQLYNIISQVSEIMTMFDSDGIVVRFMNSKIDGCGIKTEAETNNLIKTVTFKGLTPLGSAFEQKIIKPFVREPIRTNNMYKPILAIIITDGEPSNDEDIKFINNLKTIYKELKHTNYGSGTLAIQIAQVGNDLNAHEFLSSIDNDKDIGKYIDCTSNFELEANECIMKQNFELTFDLWLLKMCLGAIDQDYDNFD